MTSYRVKKQNSSNIVESYIVGKVIWWWFRITLETYFENRYFGWFQAIFAKTADSAWKIKFFKYSRIIYRWKGNLMEMLIQPEKSSFSAINNWVTCLLLTILFFDKKWYEICHFYFKEKKREKIELLINLLWDVPDVWVHTRSSSSHTRSVMYLGIS